MKRGEMRLANETQAVLKSYLVKRGVPLPPGAVKKESGVSVTDAEGKALPCEGKVLQRRPDGSIEWLLMDILVDLGPQEETSVFIVPKSAPRPRVRNAVKVEETKRDVTLTNGLTELVIAKGAGSLIRRLTLNGKQIVGPRQCVDLEVADGGGKLYRASLDADRCVTVTHANRLCTTVTVRGKHVARDGTAFLLYALRFTLAANCPDLTLDHTFYCHEDVDGKVLVKSMRLVMPTTMDGAATKLLCQRHRGHDFFPHHLEVPENVEIVSSAVADIDNYRQNAKGPGVSHPCAGGNVFLRNVDSLHEDWNAYPFHMRPGQGSGFRADIQVAGVRTVLPIVGWKGKGYTLVTAFEHWRQLHPKSIALDESLAVYSIWPEWSTPMEIVRGVSKSHIIFLTGEPRDLDMDDVLDHAGRWEHGYSEPVDISFDPTWPAHCEVLDCHHVLRYQPDKYPLLENLIEPVPSAGNPSRHSYDRQAATGMFHFGCIVNDDATSCSNNEDDRVVFFPLQHFLRTGQTYAWDYGKEAARHYMEVDFCEWSTDPRQNGGLIPHTGQHFFGCVYCSHQWAEGILTYYYLSGDERARNVVVSVGNNHCYWIYNAPHIVSCDGREAGMPLVNLAAAYRLTGDEKYVAAAKQLCEIFFHRWTREFGEFKYPSPQGSPGRPHKLITGYGDWSSFAGLYRMWEVTGEEEFKELAVKLLRVAIKPGSFSLNDARGMDFFAAWILGRLTGDMDGAVKLVERATPMLLRRGGHPLRRLHFLKELDERGLIDDKQSGTRGGVI